MVYGKKRPPYLKSQDQQRQPNISRGWLKVRRGKKMNKELINSSAATAFIIVVIGSKAFFWVIRVW